jgi:hypothetical protein
VIDPRALRYALCPGAITFHVFSVKNFVFLTTLIYTSDGYCFE